MDIRVKPVRQADISALYAMHSDEVSVWQAGVGLSGRTHADFEARWLKKAKGTEDIFISSIWAGGHLVGDVSSFLREGKREVGYWLDRKYWGKGISTKALRRFLPLIKEVYPKSALYARVVDGNIPSSRVLGKCGFQPIGRDSFYSDVRGCDVDETLYHHVDI